MILLLTSIPCYALRLLEIWWRTGLVYHESRLGPGLQDRGSNAAGDRRPALDCREHPPAERACGPGTSTSEGGPLDGLGSAIRSLGVDRASWKQGLGSEQGRNFERLALAHRGDMAPPQDFLPTAPSSADPQRIEHRRDDSSEPEQAHHIPQGRRRTLLCASKSYSWGGSMPSYGDAAAAFSGPRRRGQVNARGPAEPFSRPAKWPITEGLDGQYTP